MRTKWESVGRRGAVGRARYSSFGPSVLWGRPDGFYGKEYKEVKEYKKLEGGGHDQGFISTTTTFPLY